METSILGERFGKLVVIGPSAEIRYGCHTVLCRCDCGNLTYVLTSSLRNGNTRRFGCRKTRDISGKRFGSLVAVEPMGEVHPTNKTRLWRCVCDCGRETVVDYKHLADGERVSCGCLRSGPRSARMKSLASLAPSV